MFSSKKSGMRLKVVGNLKLIDIVSPFKLPFPVKNLIYMEITDTTTVTNIRLPSLHPDHW